mmetsp:Transcript_1102/g.2242  ORF Transcript_1102/g.2242 Transcript_1102/m.2242 type:complete len:441 (+) Transcript_1102:83-1405(+)
MVLLSEVVEHHVDSHHHTDTDHTELYKVMQAEHDAILKHRSGTLYRSKLWSSIAPAGNIYRYVGLLADFRVHSYDLQCQLLQVADKHKDLLGAQLSQAERSAKLLELLKSTTATDAEGGFISKGWLPLEVYLRDGVDSLGFWLMPEDKQPWMTQTFLALMICTVQIVCPLLILLDEWSQPSNKLAVFQKFVENLKFSELICLGTTSAEKCHTLMGVLLLLLVLLIIRSYVQEQRAHGYKSGRLPTNRFWMVLGAVTNMWSAVVVSLALPLRFWDEGNSTSIALDAMSLLFLFMLDDFSGLACVYMGKSDESFQRDSAWNKALLSHCPVRLEDFINERARTADELWQIRTGNDSTLLASRPGEPERKCKKRLARIYEETTGLLDGDYHMLYCTSADKSRVLPDYGDNILDFLWRMIDTFLTIWGLVVPFLWMAVDQPCSKN